MRNKLVAVVSSLALAVGAFAVVAVPKTVNADVDEITPIVRVASESQFHKYIADDGMYVSRDYFSSGSMKEFGELHSFYVWGNDSKVMFAPVGDEEIEYQLYGTDRHLSKLGNPIKTYSGVSENVTTEVLDEGVYYYQAYTTKGFDMELSSTMFIGEIPSNGKVDEAWDTVSEGAVDDYSIGDAVKLKEPDDIESSEVLFTGAADGYGDWLSVNVKEDGWLFLSADITKGEGLTFRVYSNNTATDQCGSVYDASRDGVWAGYVSAGTYYIQGYTDGIAFYDMKAGIYPAENRVRVSDISLAEDRKSAVVTLDYNPDFCDSFSISTKDETLTSACNEKWGKTTSKTGVFRVTKNGNYTIRTEGSDGYNCYAKFEVTGIKEATLSVAKVKAGSRYIKGKGEVGRTVCIYMKGNKDMLYSAKVGRNGTWSVKLGSKTKKGQVVCAYYLNDKGENLIRKKVG